MDAPKRKYSWLECFPRDIWAYIIWYLPGEVLGRLMITGATYLWQLLKSPRVVKSVIIGEEMDATTSCPRFLNDFPSLEDLRIHDCKKPDRSTGKCYPVACLEIGSVPSGVRKLSTKGSFFETSNLAIHLPQLETLSIRGTPNDLWMIRSPQSLTKLVIQRWDGNVELPSSLIHFTASIVTLYRRRLVRKLPPLLASFVVNSLVRGVDRIVPLLPSSVNTLRLGTQQRYEAGAMHNLLELLPKSLTRFTIPTLTHINFVTNPELISLLPSTLTELDISSVFPCSAWSLLPHNLRKLVFNGPEILCTVVSKRIENLGVFHEVRSIPFHFLPKSITEIRFLFAPFQGLSFCGPPTTFDHSYFPPKLTSLCIPQVQLSPETAKLLPSSLTGLELGALCERVCEYLPAGLEELWANRALICPNLIKSLPESLTSLSLGVARAQDHWFDCNTGEKVESISTLPKYSIRGDSLDWKDSSSLPPRLTSLSLRHADQLEDLFLLHQRHPQLLHLHLDHFKHCTDFSIPLLSPKLRSLSLMSSSKVSGKSFCTLPRYLVRIDLSGSESIFDSDIQNLPRYLKSANFKRAIHLTDLCIPDLPPQLDTLDLSCNSHISPSSFDHLPLPFRSHFHFQYSYAHFAKWCISNGVVHLR